MNFFVEIWKDYSETASRFVGSFDISQSLSFGTSLSGGYGPCSFLVETPYDQRYVQYREFLGRHVVIRDMYGRRLYIGTVLKTEVVPEGVSVEAIGYYSKADNVYFDMIYPYIEATTNLIKNPSFTVNVTDSWNINTGTGGSVVRHTDDSFIGGASCKITQPDSGADGAVLAYVAVSPNTYYTFSIYAKDINLSGKPSLWFYEDGGGGISHHIEMTSISKSSWVRYIVTVETVSDTGSISVGVSVPNKGSGAQGAFMVDAAQLEQKSYATEYADGSLGPLYTWLGTADNSESTRAAVQYTVSDIVKDCIDMIPEWDSTKVFISNSDYIVGEQDFTDKKVKDAIESVIQFGYKESDIRPVYFGIWADRIAYLTPEPSMHTRPDWVLTSENLKKSLSGLSLSVEGIFNKVYALYDDAEGPVKTLPAEDKYSQTLYGVIEGMVQNGGNREGVALANDLRDMALERHKYPRQVYTLSVSGFVQAWNGHYDFPYMIKAGDLVSISDLDILTAIAGVNVGIVASGVTGLVVQTEYDAGSNTSSITFGSDDLVFESLMSRLGLTGGLQ